MVAAAGVRLGDLKAGMERAGTLVPGSFGVCLGARRAPPQSNLIDAARHGRCRNPPPVGSGFALSTGPVRFEVRLGSLPLVALFETLPSPPNRELVSRLPVALRGEVSQVCGAREGRG